MGAVSHHHKVVVICYTVWKTDARPSPVTPNLGRVVSAALPRLSPLLHVH